MVSERLYYISHDAHSTQKEATHKKRWVVARRIGRVARRPGGPFAIVMTRATNESNTPCCPMITT